MREARTVVHPWVVTQCSVVRAHCSVAHDTYSGLSYGGFTVLAFALIGPRATAQPQPQPQPRRLITAGRAGASPNQQQARHIILTDVWAEAGTSFLFVFMAVLYAQHMLNQVEHMHGNEIPI